MSLASNTIRPSDRSITPIKLKYDSLYTSSLDVDTCRVVFLGTTITSAIAKNSDASLMNSTGSEGRLYRMVKQLYFQNYFTGSLLNSASYWDWNWQSTTYSGSQEYEYRYLPTGSNDKIAVIYIPRNYAGEQISRLTFNLKPIIGSTYDIWDDGNGNLIDRNNNNVHVGTIIYSNGIIVITNTDYSTGFASSTCIEDPYYAPVGPITGYADTAPGNIYVEKTP